MPQLFFTKAAALRILQVQGIAAKQVESIRVFKGSIQITYTTKNGRCSTFLSKTRFYSDFISFRQEGAKTCTVKRWSAGSYQNHYECFSGKGENIRTVRLVAGTVDCSCLDWDKQRVELGKLAPGCKHVLATLLHVGYNSVTEYIEAKKAEVEAKFLTEVKAARASLFGEDDL